MTVKRIQNLDINSRDLFTGICGLSATTELYVENNLCVYTRLQELYRYLCEEGYITIFYNPKENFFSYRLYDLELFLGKIPEEAPIQKTSPKNTENATIHHPRCRGPLGAISSRHQQTVQSSTQTQANTSDDTTPYADIIRGGNLETGQFYQTKRNENRIFDMIFHFVDKHRNRQLVVVFTDPEQTNIDNVEITRLKEREGGYKKTGMPLRIIALYRAQNPAQLLRNANRSFFYNTFFVNCMFPSTNGEQSMEINDKYLFHVDRPEQDEIGNVLKRRRIMEGLQHTLAPIPFDNLCLRIWQQFKVKLTGSPKERDIDTVAELMNLPKDVLESKFLEMDNEKAIDKLNKMLGIDKLLEQFSRYCKAYHDYIDGNGGNTFRPHMAFMGNPGTGKTTIARLFADMLREEGLLSRGHLIEAKVSDLIDRFVGGTRPRTQAVCDRAKGGVLFIDEAYGLMSGDNVDGHIDYGKEAIEVLIQFMENNDDSIVIFAGYPKEIMNLINEGNPGFRSRFNESIGFFYFDDYKPGVLYEIAMKNIPDTIETTEEFRIALRNIIEIKYAYRTKKFGNARDMENIANTIVSSYRDSGDKEPLDVRHLPDDLRVLVDPSMMNEETMLAELNEKIVGQENIKNLVSNLFTKCLADRTKMSLIKEYRPEVENLNFVFVGNPGTGKTTVARIMGKLLNKMGILSSNDNSVITEISGGTMTHMTPERIKKLFEDNVGKVIFIDEAYQLKDNQQVITEIVNNATSEDYKNKLCLIMAGYTAQMHEMMSLNPGMFSRFTEVMFKDYTNEELWTILKRKVNQPESQCLIDEEKCEQLAISYFASQKRGEGFGNARIIEKELLPNLKMQRDRRYTKATDEQKKDPNYAKKILPEDFPKYRKKIDKKGVTPSEQLKRLTGIDNIKAQFDRYCKAYQDYINGIGGNTFRPHMIFMGNPGTGKTTIARLFGEILHEKGVLPQGHYVEAKVSDLIDRYIGGTRPKTQAVCDRAKGGVLFIDEAYGLMSGDNVDGHIDYGKEAIEVLIQFMENNDDSIVIFAGYPKEIMNLINEGNPGFRSRFNESIGFFYFDDYKPGVLYEIAMKNIPDTIETTEEFRIALRNIIEIKYAYRTKKFGNARDMENIANTIVSSYRDSGDKEPLDVRHLPDDLRVLVDPSMMNEETMLAELNEKIVGQENIKTIIRKLFMSVRTQRVRLMKRRNAGYVMPKMNYVFTGNPGTGKSTVAKMMGDILRKMGIITSGESSILTVISGNELIIKTPQQIQKLFEDNIGKVLVIDEAYALANYPRIITDIVNNTQLPDYKDKMCIILAGYSDEMHEMMKRNPGMKSRFEEVSFEDYSDEELWEILQNMIKSQKDQIIMDPDSCREPAMAFFKSCIRDRNFGNARVIERELLPKLLANRDARLGDMNDLPNDDPYYDIRIFPEDFPSYAKTTKTKTEFIKY